MDWITDNIAIGNYLEAQDIPLLQGKAVTAVLSLDRALQGRQPAELGLHANEVVFLEDTPGNDSRLFHCAVDALSPLSQGNTMRTRGIEADEALALVAAKREIAVTADVERFMVLHHPGN